MSEGVCFFGFNNGLIAGKGRKWGLDPISAGTLHTDTVDTSFWRLSRAPSSSKWSSGRPNGAPRLFWRSRRRSVETRGDDELRGFKNAGEVAARAVGRAGGRTPARSAWRGDGEDDGPRARARLESRRSRRNRPAGAVQLGDEGHAHRVGRGAGGRHRLLGPPAPAQDSAAAP